MSSGVLQKLLWHAKRLFHTTSNSDSPTILQRGLMIGGESRTTSPPAARQSGDCSGRRFPSDDDLIAHAVRHSGLSKGRDEDVALYVEAYRAGALNGRDIRKRGRLMTTVDKKARGINFRGMFTFELLETLNESGAIDPVDSIWTICSYANRLISSRDSLRSTSDAGIGRVKFRFGGMAAGHCDYSQRMDGKTVPTGEAPLLPPAECEHPDQCGCRWQSWIPLMDEIE